MLGQKMSYVRIGHDSTGITNKASAHPPCAVILTRSGRICGCSFSCHRPWNFPNVHHPPGM